MKMLKVKTMFKFLEKKVPLGVLLFAGIFIIAESAQIMSETRLRSEHRKYWIEKESEKQKNWYYVTYSFVANLVSFGTGFFLARVLPGIF